MTQTKPLATEIKNIVLMVGTASFALGLIVGCIIAGDLFLK